MVVNPVNDPLIQTVQSTLVFEQRGWTHVKISVDHFINLPVIRGIPDIGRMEPHAWRCHLSLPRPLYELAPTHRAAPAHHLRGGRSHAETFGQATREGQPLTEPAV